MFPCSDGGLHGGCSLGSRVAVPAKVTPDKKRVFATRLRDGWSIADSARAAGVSYAWAKAYAKGLKNSSGREWAASGQEQESAEPVPLGELCPEAQAALEDITMFARLYFGAVVMPWQVEATSIVTALLDTPDEEYLVINCPPGSGKSTFFTKILPAWLTCKRRHIRGMIGSAAMTLAKQYVGELRDIFASPAPLSQNPEAIQRGYAVSPERCLVTDFGVFKDADRKWASDSFFVQQHGGQLFGAKEPTWQAFGRGSKFIGARVDFCIWDDLYDPEDNRTEDAKEGLRRWFDQYAETRIEPGGLFVLQGQRLEANDIYRYALDKVTVSFDAEGEETGERRPKYHHIRFQAHYEDRCSPEHHRNSAPPYPDGCLLFPRRLPWQKLRAVKENSPEEYEVVYQQGESAPGQFLVDKVWVEGGRYVDEHGMLVEAPGCWDPERGLGEIPKGLTAPFLSIVTADPSPSKYWAIQWWVYHPETQHRYLLDAERKVMGADDFIDFELATKTFTGMMPDWQERSIAAGAPIRYWIVESNAAQRFMLRYDFARTWLGQNSVDLIPHDTNRNKWDSQIGVTTLGPHWRYGRVRLPGRLHDTGRLAAAKLVSEVTRYRKDGKPSGSDDQVMAEWFLEVRLPTIPLLEPSSTRSLIPTWLRRAAA